jgi:hypothetical protein
LILKEAVMRWLTALLIAGSLVLAGAHQAQARRHHFHGPHPVSPGLVKGMCYIQGPHVHAYVPHKPVLYVKRGRHHVFVGDPVEFEAEAPRHAYYGHHPVFWAEAEGPEGHYCYITGPHFHWYAPPAAIKVKFKRKGGVYWWVGGHPKHYRPRHWRARAINVHYKPMKIHRPVVVVSPPVGFVGVVVSTPAVEVHGPGVKVFAPFGVRIGPPYGKAHGHYKHKRGRGHFKVKGHGRFKGHRHGRYKGHRHGMYRGRHRGMHRRHGGRKGGRPKGRRKGMGAFGW